MASSPKEIEKALAELSASAESSLSRAGTASELETLRVAILGRKGRLTELLKALKDLPLEAKRALGPEANGLKERLETLADARAKELELSGADASAAGVDMTLPAPRTAGALHPLTQVIDEMAAILERLGFSWAEGPLIEDDRHNFEALNVPADHPARDMQDTFYLERPEGRLLRTQTSSVQIRHLESRKPPVRVMAPGRVFRREAVDASHSAVFHQVEGLYVDRSVTMADLRGTLEAFLRAFLGPATKTRFRPSYFPFTEPSADVYASCPFCPGSGCRVCKQSGWIELLGCGLVHAKVLEACGLDPAAWSGFAFGIGVERFAMLKLGVPDIRLFYENDVRFLGQFR